MAAHLKQLSTAFNSFPMPLYLSPAIPISNINLIVHEVETYPFVLL